MILTDSEVKVMLACMQWAAMEHDKRAKAARDRFDLVEAATASAFSMECARIADKLVRKA